MGQKKIRDYEVSIWTLQDEFITVLKPSHLEHRGQIEQGKQKILDDGTLSLTFSIPMYLYFGKNRSENPIWHNVKDGTIVANMRKIKVIFNKDEHLDDGFYRDNVFEFLIVNVKERHENDQVYCDIECEGLAFHELGKIGYKVSLASDDFYNDDFKFFTDGFWIDSNGEEIESAPRANIQYWLNKFLKPAPETINLYDRTEWYYKIEMNWDSFAEDEGQARKSDIIYEEPYTASWKLAEGILVPDIIESYKEKERLVDLEESNHYNLTQNLAETFGVFCTYRYLYNSNYQIIGREIVFYNNFMKEQEGYLSLTYPYSTAAITREQDSKDLTSKMFVKPVTDEANATGMITIMDVEANRSGEDYLLNFDYLYSINAITDEQYDEIDLFESKMGQLNKKLIELAEQIDALREEKIDVEATLTTAINAIPLDQERITAATALLDNLIKKHGNAANTGIAVTAQNPDSAILLHDANDAADLYYFTLKKAGIDPKTLHIYSNYNYSTHALSAEINNWTIEYDEEYGEVNKIKYVNKPNGGIVYFVYTYIPKLYYDKVIDTWTTKLAKDQADKELSETRLNEIENQLSELQIEYDNKLIEKKKTLKDFEKMMGPALRESYWMPEDYSNYGDIYTDNFLLVQSSISGASGKTEFIWDNVPFDGEQIGYYEYGINKEKKYYPIISLQGHLNTVQQMLNSLSFIYYDPAMTSQDVKLKYARSYPINSKCQYGFARINENNEEKVIPVLILTGYEDIIKTSVGGESDSSLFNSLINESQLGEYQVNVEGTNVSININNAISSLNFINYNASNASKFDAVELVYPRLKVNSLALKTSSDQLALKYNDKTLNEYEDYSILTRVDANASKGAYYITLRPATLIGNAASLNADVIKFKFTLSNADTAIYLDAKQILKENSVPKVSYTITPSVVDDEFLYTAYNKLSRICNINDTDLKFRNMQGYISEIDLDLDMPWNDKFEIKNYKTKFEDLFSTIVAQSEEMKKSGYTIAQMANNLNDNGEVRASAIEATPLWQDSFDDYFTNSEKVKEYFKRVFDEAGTILGNAASSLDNLQDVSAQNAAILSGFAVNVQNGLAPTYTKSATPPLDFKAGDIWEDSNDNRYVATANSTDVINAGNGWTQTYDGTFVTKRIQGAKLDIDTEAGTIDMLAENRIDIKSGSDLYIAANDNVAIVGNNSVNIGGAQINIAADGSGNQGGIHLVATDYEAAADTTSTAYKSATRVDLTADGLEIFTGGDSTTEPPTSSASATKIDKDGIYLGSTGSINLYSGSLDPDDSESSTTVQLNNNYLIFGASNGSQGTSAKLTDEKIVLAAGDQINNVTEASLSQTGSVSGVLIEKDFIGLATGTGSTRTSVILNNNGIRLGAGTSSGGSTLTLEPNGITLNSNTAKLNVGTTNVVINSEATGTNEIFRLGDTSSPKLKYTAANGLEISGNVTADSGTIGGWTIRSETDSSTNQPHYWLTSTDQRIGLRSWQTTEGDTFPAIWAGRTNNDSRQSAFRVYNDGSLFATKATVSGDITATSGKIGNTLPWNIIDGKLYSGSGNTYVALDSGASGTASTNYAIWAGSSDANSAPFSVTRGGKLKASGAEISGDITISSANTFNVSSNGFNVNSSGYQVPGTNEYIVLWAGQNSQGTSDFDKGSTPFFVTSEGKLYASQIYTRNGNVEKQFNVSQLNDAVKTLTVDGSGYATYIELYDGRSANFKRAAVETSWLTTGLSVPSSLSSSITAYATCKDPNTSGTGVTVSNPMAGTLNVTSVTADTTNKKITVKASATNSGGSTVAEITKDYTTQYNTIYDDGYARGWSTARGKIVYNSSTGYIMGPAATAGQAAAVNFYKYTASTYTASTYKASTYSPSSYTQEVTTAYTVKRTTYANTMSNVTDGTRLFYLSNGSYEYAGTYRLATVNVITLDSDGSWLHLTTPSSYSSSAYTASTYTASSYTASSLTSAS